jgi:ribonuclease P protein component
MQRRLRLHRNSDFQRLRNEGMVKRHPMLILSYAPNDLSHNRYGFITSKRLGKAVHRNRIRRLMREAVRLQQPQIKYGYDCVLIARPAIMGQPLSEVQRIVYELYRRADLVL